MDNLDQVWDKFYKYRTVDLFNRFNGWYRAEVVETNDPLQIHRIRFRMPEMHDRDMKPEDCPWATPAPWLGGKNAGSWSNPLKGDIVFIVFEKNHPYHPIWCGFATGTRRKRYPLESTYTRSPLALDLQGDADETPDDYLQEYLPKDNRPMSNGHRDRYGSFDINSSVGFYPIEHEESPSVLGTDPISKSEFKTGSEPEVNNPDRKYKASVTKYGVMTIQSDVGYWWKKDGDVGEFEGDFDEDREFEIKRSKYLTKLLNENQPDSSVQDQRRYEILTRSGHKFEMRDVGWAQSGGGLSGCEDAGKTKSRADEYDEPRVLSKYSDSDERWMKLRTKGGHLIQLMDAGFHPEEDDRYKKNLLEEVGSLGDLEKEAEWDKRDSRQIRFVTRHGFKFVLDDRGSDPRRADLVEVPHGNGFLLKTRRSHPDDESTSRGFGFEANDKDDLNASKWYSPKSKAVELNDREDYVMMCTDTNEEMSREWMGLKENEFSLKALMVEKPEEDTYHLKLDKHNGYLRLKTSGGRDNGRRSGPLGLSSAETGLQQGIEIRDGRAGTDGAWAEIVDIEHRGLWFSKKEKVGVWRSTKEKEQYIAINDGKNSIIIRNNEDGPVQIFCKKDIELISGQNISLKAAKKISFKAGTTIDFESASSGHAQLSGQAWTMDVPDNAPEHTGVLPGAMPGPGAQSDTGGKSDTIDPQEIEQEKREPMDRGFVNNNPTEVEEIVVKECE